MKYLIRVMTALFCLALLPFTGKTQMNKQVVGTATSVLASGFTGGVYTIQCNFISFQSYSSGTVQVGDTYSVEYSLSTPKATVRFDIESVTPVSGSRIELELRPLDGASLITFPSTNATIYRQTTSLDLGLIEANTSDFLKAGLFNHNFIVLDSAINAFVAPTGIDTSLQSVDMTLNEIRTIYGVYPSASIVWDSVDQHFVVDSFIVSSDDQIQLTGDTVRLKSTAGGIILETPNIESGTPAIGHFFVLQDETTGRGEWDAIGKYLPPDSNTDSLYFAYGDAGVDSTLLKTRGDTIWLDFGAGQELSEYELLSGDVTVMGTAGITAAFASGEYTITVPTGGVISGYSVVVDVADATYTNGTVSDAIKITVDNTANGTTLRGVSPLFFARTAAGAVTAGNPLQYNTSLNTSMQIDEFAAGITSIIYQQVPGNAAAGGIVMW